MGIKQILSETDSQFSVISQLKFVNTQSSIKVNEFNEKFRGFLSKNFDVFYL